LNWMVTLALVVSFSSLLIAVYSIAIVLRMSGLLHAILSTASVNHRIRKALEKASQKPRKRYIVFLVEASENVEEHSLAKAIIEVGKEVMGYDGLVDSGLHLVHYDPMNKLGVVRVRHTYKYHALAILGLIREIGGVKVRLIPLRTSGTLKRALKHVGVKKSKAT
jgi:ribonuclease P/MRP protein subunit POP5